MLGRMITSDRASLSVLSTDTDPSDITRLLRVEPTRVRRAGETRRSGRIWWSADSDSSQGGFVLPVELAVQIAALGVDLYGTVFVEPEAADEEE